MERAVADCPEVDVLLEDMPITCLIDTGSQVTTITESFFRRLSGFHLFNVGNMIRITGANELEVPCLGYIEVRIEISGILVPQVGVLVIKDPVDAQGLERKKRVPGLLGSNFFSALKKCMDQQDSAVPTGDKYLRYCLYMRCLLTQSIISLVLSRWLDLLKLRCLLLP